MFQSDKIFGFIGGQPISIIRQEDEPLVGCSFDAWLLVNVLIVEEIVPDVMIDGDMGSKCQF